MNRWKAAAAHLLLSLVLIGGIALLALYTWFPYQLYRIAAPDKLLYLMWGIDVAAGPLLTLVVYKADKPSLRFDLTMIVLLQLGFLASGLYTLWGSRPVFLVGMTTRMSLVFANEVDDAALDKAANPAWRRLAWNGPVLVGAMPPINDKERQDLLFATLASGIDLDKMPDRFVDYPLVAPSLMTVGKAVGISRARRADISRPVIEVTLISARGEGVMWLDAVSGEPVTTWSLAEREMLE